MQVLFTALEDTQSDAASPGAPSLSLLLPWRRSRSRVVAEHPVIVGAGARPKAQVLVLVLVGRRSGDTSRLKSAAPLSEQRAQVL